MTEADLMMIKGVARVSDDDHPHPYVVVIGVSTWWWFSKKRRQRLAEFLRDMTCAGVLAELRPWWKVSK